MNARGYLPASPLWSGLDTPRAFTAVPTRFLEFLVEAWIFCHIKMVITVSYHCGTLLNRSPATGITISLNVCWAETSKKSWKVQFISKRVEVSFSLWVFLSFISSNLFLWFLSQRGRGGEIVCEAVCWYWRNVSSFNILTLPPIFLSELSLSRSLGYLYLIFIIVWVKEHPWALHGYHTLFASIYSRLFHRIGEAIVIYGPMSMYIQWFSFFACLPCFPALQWSLKTPRQIISMLHQTSIVQTTDNKLNSSKGKSLPADSQGRCYLPDVWLSLLLTCLISAPSNESVLILQSRMCSVSIDSKWPLFRLDFYFICLNDFVSFKPVFMWKIQIMLSNLHFKKTRIFVFMKSLLSCNYSSLSLAYTTCNWVNTVNEGLVLLLMSY